MRCLRLLRECFRFQDYTDHSTFIQLILCAQPFHFGGYSPLLQQSDLHIALHRFLESRRAWAGVQEGGRHAIGAVVVAAGAVAVRVAAVVGQAVVAAGIVAVVLVVGPQRVPPMRATATRRTPVPMLPFNFDARPDL